MFLIIWFKKKNRHSIPYAKCKITVFLKHTLSGNCRTAMIGCVSLHSKNFKASEATIKYTCSAAKIENKLQRQCFCK